MKYSPDGLETERLRFALLERTYETEWLGLFKTEGVTRFLGLTHLPGPEAQCNYWFESNFFKYKNDLGGMHALLDKTTGKLIGQCGLFVEVVDGINELEIGYSILPAHWGKGYATEAVISCRDFAFENNYSSSLISLVHIDNHASARVATHNGMQIDKQSQYKGMPVNVFRITTEQYNNGK